MCEQVLGRVDALLTGSLHLFPSAGGEYLACGAPVAAAPKRTSHPPTSLPGLIADQRRQLRFGNPALQRWHRIFLEMLHFPACVNL